MVEEGHDSHSNGNEASSIEKDVQASQWLVEAWSSGGDIFAESYIGWLCKFIKMDPMSYLHGQVETDDEMENKNMPCLVV